jgi:hypothetical protein
MERAADSVKSDPSVQRVWRGMKAMGSKRRYRGRWMRRGTGPGRHASGARWTRRRPKWKPEQEQPVELA